MCILELSKIFENIYGSKLKVLFTDNHSLMY